MSKQYVFFKDGGVIRRGHIVGENGDRVVVSYRAKRIEFSAYSNFQVPSYFDKLLEFDRSDVFTEVGNVV